MRINNKPIMPECKYKFSLGIPNKGFHTHIGGVAMGDVIATLLGVWILVYFTHWDFSLVAAVAFLLAFLLHKWYCVN